MKIKIFELTGKNAVTYRSGAILAKKIESVLNEKEIILDFEGVKVISSQFLNISVGVLLKDLQRSEVELKIKVINAPEHTEILLKEVFDNAEKFY